MTVPVAPEPSFDGHYVCDVLIVGAGIAGLQAARFCDTSLDVIVLDKGVSGRSGSSPWAQGGMAVALGPDDSPELHATDTVAASDGLTDPAAVRVLATETPDRADELVELGAQFDREPDGAVHLAREGGHTVARSIHRADATGQEIVRVLRDAAAQRVTRLEGVAVRLDVTADGRCTGAWTIVDGRLALVKARAVILATGGAGALYASTTNQPGATGDGVSLAHRAGAAVRDMEFIQFHPTALAGPDGSRFLLTEALRGAGATLHDEAGTRFMLDAHPDAELAPRHVVAAAILAAPGNGVALLDCTHLPLDQLSEEFPTVLAAAEQMGFDLASQPVPVTPAAHYMVGGVRTDLAGRTSIAGLWAAGEIASTGVHGANRMAGNSLAEALVFGRRAALSVQAELPAGHAVPGRPPGLDGPGRIEDDIVDELRGLLWRLAGPIRSADSLASARESLAKLRVHHPAAGPTQPSVELDHALAVAELIVTAATLRTESRGGHRRTDFPRTDPDWAEVHLEHLATRS